jgi:hypothetical protein
MFKKCRKEILSARLDRVSFAEQQETMGRVDLPAGPP